MTLLDEAETKKYLPLLDSPLIGQVIYGLKRLTAVKGKIPRNLILNLLNRNHQELFPILFEYIKKTQRRQLGEDLEPYLYHPEFVIRGLAFDCLHHLNTPGFAAKALKILQFEKENRNIIFFIKKLATLGGPTIEKSIIAFLDNTQPRIRATALESLFELNSKLIEKNLEIYLADPHHRVRGVAQKILHLMGKCPIDTIEKELESEVDLVRRTALFVLGSLKQVKIFSRISEGLSHSHTPLDEEKKLYWRLLFEFYPIEGFQKGPGFFLRGNYLERSYCLKIMEFLQIDSELFVQGIFSRLFEPEFSSHIPAGVQYFSRFPGILFEKNLVEFFNQCPENHKWRFIFLCRKYPFHLIEEMLSLFHPKKIKEHLALNQALAKSGVVQGLTLLKQNLQNLEPLGKLTLLHTLARTRSMFSRKILIDQFEKETDERFREKIKGWLD